MDIGHIQFKHFYVREYSPTISVEGREVFSFLKDTLRILLNYLYLFIYFFEIKLFFHVTPRQLIFNIKAVNIKKAG